MYRFMSEEEIEIEQISDLKMLHLYQLGGNDALAVCYGNDKQINLCAMDTHYTLLMERVLSLYSQCENKDSIIIDENTKAILEKAVGESEHYTSFFNRIGKKYLDAEGHLTPKFASEGVLRETALPTLKYYIQQMYHMWDVPVTFEKEPCGWRRNCVLKVRRKEETLILPVRMDFPRDNTCRATVGNFLKDLSSITFEISYQDDQLLVLFESKSLNLWGESHFEMSAEKLRAFTTIKVNGEVVYHQEEPIETLENPAEDLKELLHRQQALKDSFFDLEQARVYRLPWGGIAIYRALDGSDTNYIRTDYDMIYLEEYGTKLALRQFSYSLIENKADGLKLRTDGAIMRKLYYGEKHREVETLFLPAGYYSGWDYKKYLEKRYFYHELEDKE